MCGITGAIWTHPRRAIDAKALRRMTDVLAHRGPDDHGAFTSDLRIEPPYPATPGVAFGFRRLSVIDIEGSRQPLANEDGSIWLIFNGEIYNYRDLRKRLQGSGHRFATDGDAESIVHLYEDEGLGFIDHLVGQFAIAIWDRDKRRLVLARDRLGQKPLLYRHDADRLLFASELKSILQAPGIPRDIDPNAIDEYLTYQYIPHPQTIFRGVRKLPPGHLAVFENDALTLQRYWAPDLNEEFERPPGEYAAELRERLTESVRLRLQSDVPLGVFLSGGVDSSIIAAVARKLSSEPIKTFSIGFPVADYDESDAAARVAAHLGAEHHALQVESNDIDILPKLVWHFDEPFGDSSAVPTYYLARLSRGEVTVALSGDGADELFAGYLRYRAVGLAERFDQLPRWMRGALSSRLWNAVPSSHRQHSRLRMWKRFCEALALSPQRRYANWVGILRQDARAALYTDAFLETLSDDDPTEFLLTAFRRAKRRDAISAASLADMQTYLPCDICNKIDIATMAHSLECRQPFLDHRVAELAIQMPIREKVRRGRGKHVLREAFGDLLPDDVFTRPKKGFGVPLDDWFRGPINAHARDVLLDSRTLGRGYFLEETIRRMLADHESGAANHAPGLWLLLVLETWFREWVD